MKRLLIALMMLVAVVCQASPPAPYPVTANSRSDTPPASLGAKQANQKTFRVTFKDGTNAVNTTGATMFMSWSPSSLSTSRVTSLWTVVSHTGGIHDFTFTSANLNTNGGPFLYEIGLTDSNGALAVYAQGPFTIDRSPASTGAGSISFGTNVNWSTINWIGIPNFVAHGEITGAGSNSFNVVTNHAFITWNTNGSTGGGGTGSITNILSSTAAITVSTGAGPQARINLSTADMVSALSPFMATGTPLYVESFTGSVGSLASVEAYTGRAANALASSVWASAESTTGYYQRTLGVILEGYTNRAAISLSSSVWASADSTTNYTLRTASAATNASLEARIVVTESYTSRAAVALSSSVWALAESTTGYYSRVNGNLLDARLVVVETYTSRVLGVEAYTARVVALEGYTNRAALALSSSVWASADSTTNYYTRVNGVILESYTARTAIALSSSVWSTADSTTNYALRTSDTATNAANDARFIVLESYTGRAGAALSSSVWASAQSTTNYYSRLLGIILEGYTNRAAVALASSVWASADSTTNYTRRDSTLATNALIEARIAATEGYTNRAAAALASSVWASAESTTGFARRVEWLGGSNSLSTRIADYETNGITMNSAEQVKTASLSTRGSFHASTNLVAADTNSVGSELLSNGGFTGSAAGWVLTNANYNANNVLVLPSATASITYTSTTPVVVGKVYLLSWANDLAYGTNFTRFDVVVGGDTNAFAFAPTGTIARIFKARNTQQPQFFVTPGTNQWVGDTISLKQITDGDAIIADDGFVGDQLFVGNGITTTGTISGDFVGTATGYLPLVGGTLAGHVYVSNASSFIMLGGTIGIYNTNLTTLGAQLRPLTVGPFATNWMGVLYLRGSNTVGGYLTAYETNGLARVTTGYEIFKVWDEGNDGIGSSLDAGLVEGVDMLTNGFIKVNTLATNAGAANGLPLVKDGTNAYFAALNASNLVAGSTFPAINAANLTNLPAAATTAGVNSIILDATQYIGNLAFSNSPELDVENTNAAFKWQIVAASIASNKLAATVWNQIATMGGGSSTSVVFENLDGNGDVGVASNQVARGSTVAILTVAVSSASTFWDAATKTITIDTNDATSAGGGITNVVPGTGLSGSLVGEQYFITNTVSGGSGATQAIATVGSSVVTSTFTGGTLSWSNAVTAGGGAGDVTNELNYDLTMHWGSPRWATTNNAIDLTTRVANDTLSTHTATTAVDCMIFSATCTSNIMQDVTRGFWIEMQAGTRTNFQVLLKADQTTNGNFNFLFYNPGGIGPVAYGITGGVSAANTTTTLNIPTAGTFLTNVARGVLVHGDLTCTSFSTNANNMRLQGIMGFKEQR